MANDWTSTYDAVFFISIGTMVIGLLSLIIKHCLKSKCEHFSLCFGLIKIDRRVDLEVQEEMHKIDHDIPDDDFIPLPTTSEQKTRRASKTSDNNMI